jgi:hypothetical protein
MRPKRGEKLSFRLSTDIRLGSVYRTASIVRRLVAGIERVGRQDVNPIGRASCSWGVSRNYPEQREI